MNDKLIIEELNDTSLWVSFQNGNWDAYTELYNRHFKLLNNYGHKFTRDKDLIEDAVHDLFVKLWTNKANLSVPASVKNYLYKSLRGDLLRKLKSDLKFVNLEENVSDYLFELSFDHQIIANEQELQIQKQVKKVLMSLPARQQEIIYLRFFEGLSYEEISVIMSITVNSTYKLLYKGINSMQALLKISKLSLILLLFRSLDA